MTLPFDPHRRGPAEHGHLLSRQFRLERTNELIIALWQQELFVILERFIGDRRRTHPAARRRLEAFDETFCELAIRRTERSRTSVHKIGEGPATHLPGLDLRRHVFDPFGEIVDRLEYAVVEEPVARWNRAALHPVFSEPLPKGIISGMNKFCA